jgi:hypothetical protein
MYLSLLRLYVRPDLGGHGCEGPAALSVELEEVGVELGEGGAVGHRQQRHTNILGGLQPYYNSCHSRK